MGLSYIVGETGIPYRQDLSKSLSSIEYEHSKLHEGKYFEVTNIWTSLADAGKKGLLINSDGVVAHLIVSVQALGNCIIRITEGVSFTAETGTEKTVFNKKRSSSNSCNCTVIDTPSGLSGGTEIESYIIPAGSGPQAGGSTSRANKEINLKELTNYYIEIENISGLAKSYSMILQWYEV